MVYSITCGMAKDSMRPCLVLAPGQVPTRPCCDALQAIEFQATTKQIRQFYCNCFKNVIHSSPYVKLIPLPELCRIPITGILTPPHGCDRLCHQELGLRLWDEELPTPTIEKIGSAIRLKSLKNWISVIPYIRIAMNQIKSNI
uniref:Bifunctional inhibitor/plant lipid transfer protein/seed storage helical domain-containing protein n=1 Tax=Brassica campestris TaxID=3711 RepID=M4EKK6_BRACM